MTDGQLGLYDSGFGPDLPFLPESKAIDCILIIVDRYTEYVILLPVSCSIAADLEGLVP